MEKAVTALFNQLLLLFSIMQGINAEPLTFLPMKGDEGYYIVILLVIVCMLGTYIDKMKGEGFFSFRISNFQLFHSPIFNLFGLVRFCMHGDKIYFLLSC